jgi:hypothetical protein
MFERRFEVVDDFLGDDVKSELWEMVLTPLFLSRDNFPSINFPRDRRPI